MSDKLTITGGDAKSGEEFAPVSKHGSPQLEMLIKFKKNVRGRIPEGLTVEEFERRRMAILAAFISNGYADEISGECEEIRQTPQIAGP